MKELLSIGTWLLSPVWSEPFVLFVIQNHTAYDILMWTVLFMAI
jgi:hypothetical protein